jgi:hypothetical protein
MAWESKEICDIGHLTAAADYSAKQYYAMYQSSSTAVTLAATAGQKTLGPLQNVPTSGKPAVVRLAGISKVFYGGTVTAGDPLTTDASGKYVTATDSSSFIAGYALLAGSASDIGVMYVAPSYSDIDFGKTLLALPINLASITTNMDVLTTWTPGFAGVITKVTFAVTVPVTTGSKLTTLTTFIGSTAVTGGVCALTSATCTPLGALVAGTSVTAANSFGATDTISVKSTSTTAFAEGAGVLIIGCK